VCPGYVLQRDQWTLPLIHWWQFSSPWDGATGQPSGPPEWPEPGGMMNQDAKLVDLVMLLRSEWPHIAAAPEPAAARK